MIWRALRVALVLVAAHGVAHGDDTDTPRPFVPGSYSQIVREHAGTPFILALWSIDCAPCHDELALLARLRKQHRHMKLVLVSTDAGATPAALRALLQRHGLGHEQSWVFADDYVEKLRFEIDREWRGELPRTYLIPASGQRRALSGRLEARDIERWLAAVTARASSATAR